MIDGWLTTVARWVGRRKESSPWARLLQREPDRWRSARSAASGPRVLLATTLGGYDHGAMLESVLAAALTLRGARVEILLCDSQLPACQLTKHSKITPETLTHGGQKRICDQCVPAGTRLFEPVGLPLHWLGAQLTPADLDEAERIARSAPRSGLQHWVHDGLALGEHAYAGALRYFGRGDLEGEALAQPVLDRYIHAAVRTALAVKRLLQRERYDAVCFHHGIYVPQGIIGEVCRAAGVRIVNWNPAYRRQTFIFSHDDTYHHTMVTEPVDVWERLPWTQASEDRILAYLKSRWTGSEDWIWFHEHPTERHEAIAREVGYDPSRPCIGMLTSVMWDAQLHYRSNAFPNMLEWVRYTIDYFAGRPELQLLIRIHPAEVRGMVPSRQPMAAEIHRLFPRLPGNVFVIPPESRISTYALLEQCETALIYNTKTGIELASTGLPVVVAGEAWIRGKGFSADASSPVEYRGLLDQLPLPGMDGARVERARKYAFHFFFRRMIPVPFVTSPAQFRFAVEVPGLRSLLPGCSPGLDVICDGILLGSPFVYPAERLPC